MLQQKLIQANNLSIKISQTDKLTILSTYIAKHSSGKTFAVEHKINYSLENFRGASGCGHHVLYTASDSK